MSDDAIRRAPAAWSVIGPAGLACGVLDITVTHMVCVGLPIALVMRRFA